MVATLLEVHYNVEQGNLVSTSLGVQGLEVFRQDELVVLSAKGEKERKKKKKDHHIKPLCLQLLSKITTPPQSPPPLLTSAWG